MALSEKSRTLIYTGLTDLVGEEATAEMLTYFPARDTDEPVTKEHLRAEMADLRAETATLRTELHTDMDSFRTEMRADLDGFRTEMRSDMADLRGEVKTDIARLETALERGLRQQTIWTVSSLGVTLGIFTALNSLL